MAAKRASESSEPAPKCARAGDDDICAWLRLRAWVESAGKLFAADFAAQHHKHRDAAPSADTQVVSLALFTDTNVPLPPGVSIRILCFMLNMYLNKKCGALCNAAVSIRVASSLEGEISSADPTKPTPSSVLVVMAQIASSAWDDVWKNM